MTTVTGPAGVGKSRLGRAVAPTLVVPLSGVRNRAMASLSALLGLNPEEASLAQIANALIARGDCRVLLDDVDQCLDELSNWLPELVATAPRTAFAVSSRVLLRVPGERPMRLRPLDPDASVDLFVQRANEVDAEIEIDTNVASRLVQRLDGLPLTIELAAARAAIVGVEEVAHRLKTRLDVLSGGYRGSPARSRSIIASLQLSWNALTPTERRAWFAASLFTNAFTLADLTTVVGEDPIESVASLRLASVLQRRPDGKFAMLSMMRRFARFALPNGGVFPEDETVTRYEPRFVHDTRVRLLSWACEDASARFESLSAVLRELADHPALPSDDEQHVARGVLWWLNEALLHISDEQVQEVLKRRHESASSSAVRDAIAVGLALFDGSPLSITTLDPLVRSARFSEDTQSVAWRCVVRRAWTIGELNATIRAAERTFAMKLGGWAEASAHRFAASAYVVLKRYEEAEEHFVAALRCRDLIPPREQLGALLSYGFFLCDVGKYAEAQVLIEDAVERSEALGATMARARGLGYLGNIAREQRRFADAVALYDQAIALSSGAGDRNWVGVLCMDRAILALDHGHVGEGIDWAARAVGEVDESRVYSLSLMYGYLGAALAMAGSRDEACSAFEKAKACTSHEEHDGVVALRLHRRHLDPALPPPERKGLRGHAAWAARLLHVHHHHRHPPQGALRVGPDAITLDDGRIERSSPNGGILYALALAANRGQDDGLSVEQLVSAGWPGEQIKSKAATNRVRVAIASLRRAGFGCIETRPGGYRLKSDQHVTFALES